ncbi:MAG: cysteine peptidase family C39 domain-containing protein [Chitinophagales bacterium]|nr:cysteine peptidase family C39 domain-containing protein [Chitinophagales bacterium]
MVKTKKFPLFRQLDAMDCGPSCLRMIAKHYGKTYTLQYLRELSYIDREGVSLKGISEAAGKLGLQSVAVKIPYNNVKEQPALLAAQHILGQLNVLLWQLVGFVCSAQDIQISLEHHREICEQPRLSRQAIAFCSIFYNNS